jgi:hypothetical protein
MSKLDKKFFGENATADNWNDTDGAVIKVEYDEYNSITLPTHEDEPEEVISTSFKLEVLPNETENVAEKLAAKVMLENKDTLLAELGLNSDDYTITAEEENVEDGQTGEKEVVVTIAEQEGT